jgi:hypothetical protein
MATQASRARIESKCPVLACAASSSKVQPARASAWSTAARRSSAEAISTSFLLLGALVMAVSPSPRPFQCSQVNPKGLTNTPGGAICPGHADALANTCCFSTGVGARQSKGEAMNGPGAGAAETRGTKRNEPTRQAPTRAESHTSPIVPREVTAKFRRTRRWQGGRSSWSEVTRCNGESRIP